MFLLLLAYSNRPFLNDRKIEVSHLWKVIRRKVTARNLPRFPEGNFHMVLFLEEKNHFLFNLPDSSTRSAFQSNTAGESS